MSYYNIKRLIAITMLTTFISSSASALAVTVQSSANPSSMTLSGNVNLTKNNNKITLSLRDSDVKQVLRMFADKVGMNIVFHPSVDGKVTLDLVNMPINQAFDLVLQITNLSYYNQNNTMIIISKADPDNALYSKQEIMSFPIKYVAASKIADFLNKNVFSLKKPGLSNVDAATVNSATNELLVFGMPSDRAIIEKVIAQFDREPIAKTYKVNHTTPAEMANLICKTLLPASGNGSSDSSGGAMGGGDITGGASSLDEGGSSGGDALKLGEGIVACTASASASGNSVAPFDVQNLSITYFPQRGTITLMGGSEAQATMIEKFIKDNDIKQPQAYLEISILELNESGSRDLQNNWQFSTELWGFKFDGESTSAGRYGGMFGNYVDAVEYHYEPGKWGYSDDGGTEWKSAVFEETAIKKLMPNTTYITWSMNYVIQNNKGRVLANPKILITNGQQSTIDLTQDYVEKVTSEFVTSTSAGSGSSSGLVQRTYTISDDLGIKVELTPFISPDGYVTLNIKPEYSTIANSIYAIGETGVPELVATLLNKRNMDLKNVRIKDGETLILGGLIQEQENKSVKKIPFLGDIPYIGVAFRSTSTSKTKNELVFMITPKIINDDEGKTADTL